MTDLRTRFRALDDLRAPDLWYEIEQRSMATEPTTRRNTWVLVAVTLMLLVAIAGVALVGSGILELPVTVDASPTPSTEPTVTATPSDLPSASVSAIASASPVPAEAVWIVTGELDEQRTGHTSTLLPDGTVLVAGGSGSGGESLATALRYEPDAGTWSSVAGMAEQRIAHTATLLPDGRVLVAGGNVTTQLPSTTPLASAELYDPEAGTWAATGEMSEARAGHTATLLDDGRVLVTGGGTAELYDPSAGTWTATDSLTIARDGHTATLLPDGTVLVAGGRDDAGTDFLAAELYDPATGTWTPTGDMTEVRVEHTATLLPDGTVLVAGGTSVDPTATAEIYDPATGTWAATGSMVEARFGFTATLLPDGRLLVAGGFGITEPPTPNFLSAAELYDPTSGTWTSTVSMVAIRYDQAATLLDDGTVLVTGGEGAGVVVERYSAGSAP